VVLRHLRPTSGNSPAQVKRPVARAMAGEPLVRRHRAPPQARARCYTEADVRLLAEVDTALGTVSEPTRQGKNVEHGPFWSISLFRAMPGC
jgi:hypothetical protein